MTTARRPAQILLTAWLALATLLLAAPSPAAALEPPRPVPGHRPAFVTETDTRPWIDCLWASGAMLLDKWTAGERTITHQRLRALSGDRRGGSLFPELRAAYRKLGLRLRFSPDGGDRITMSGLLRRLSRGAGAVVLGDYSQLPRWYGRWEYGFWRGNGRNDNHAVYVERYDRKHGRVWLMDPLGRGDWHGEWISVRALARFAWSRGGALFAATTPTAKAAPFTGVRIDAQAALTGSSTTLEATWPVHAPRSWRFQGADVRASFREAANPLLAAALSPKVAERAAHAAEAPRAPVATLDGRRLVATAAMPATPGAYTASLRLSDRRFGRTVAVAEGIAVFVPGPRRAALRLHASDRGLQAGAPLVVAVSVANTGEETWAEAPVSAGGSPRDRHTRLVATWIPLDAGEAAGKVKGPEPVVLAALPLASGRRVDMDVTVTVPDTLGRWVLALDIVDDVSGSFAALGSIPAVAVFDVVTPRGIDAVN